MKIPYYNPEKGYGFLRLSDGRRVFLHVKKVSPIPPRGVDLQEMEVDEKSLQVIKTEKGWQAEQVCLINLSTRWEIDDVRLRAYFVWPGGREDSFQVGQPYIAPYSWVFIRGRSVDRPFWDIDAEQKALVQGCPLDLIEKVKVKYSVAKAEYEERQEILKKRKEALLEAKKIGTLEKAGIILSLSGSFPDQVPEDLAGKVREVLSSVTMMGSNSYYRWGVFPRPQNWINIKGDSIEAFIREDVIISRVYYLEWSRIEKKRENFSSRDHDPTLPWKYQRGSVSDV